MLFFGRGDDVAKPLRRFVGGLCLVLLVGVVAWRVLSHESFFPDNRYNLGVALRSASPRATHFLETSATFLFFEPYAVPRAESWHRGLSIIALKTWIRWTGASSRFLLQMPHLAWVSLWLALATGLLRSLVAKRCSAASHGLLILVMTVSPWAFNLLNRSYLDDVPAAVFVLAGVLWMSANPWAWFRALGGGMLFALAYGTKDFAIIWLPIGVCSYLAMYWFDSPRSSMKLLWVALGAFVAGYSLACLPKIAWNIHDLGQWPGNPIQYWMKTWYFGSRDGCMDCFKPFFLFGDTSYRSAMALSGGFTGVVRNLFFRSLRDACAAWLALGFAWWWLLPRVVEAWKGEGARRLAFAEAVLLVAMPAYFVFFALALGEGIQFRYWVVPVTLALAVGGASLERLRGVAHISWRGWVALACFAAVAVPLQANPASADRFEGSYRVMHFTPEVMEAVTAHLAPEDSVILPLLEGFSFWSERPDCNLLIFWPACLLELNDAQAQRLFDLYRVQCVIYQFDVALHARLIHWGFRDTSPLPGYMLLVRDVPGL